MGIDYSVRCFYGIIFKYDELSKMDINDNEELSVAMCRVGCEFPDELSNIWEEMDDHYCVNPYFNSDQRDILYVYGEEYVDHEASWGRMDGIITDFTTLQRWYNDNRENIERKVIDKCKQYGLKYRKPEILMLTSVY
jgi:hypothetical protein